MALPFLTQFHLRQQLIPAGNYCYCAGSSDRQIQKSTGGQFTIELLRQKQRSGGKS